jgi:hypothetical protein
MLNEVEIISVSKWLLCVYKSMDEFMQNEETLKCLRSLRMIALSRGCVTSIDNDTVFFPLSVFTDKRGASKYTNLFIFAECISAPRKLGVPASVLLLLITCHSLIKERRL